MHKNNYQNQCSFFSNRLLLYTNNLQFTSNTTAKVKTAAKGFPPKGDSSAEAERFRMISQEIKSRLEAQVKKFKRQQSYDKFNALQKEKDIKYKNILA